MKLSRTLFFILSTGIANPIKAGPIATFKKASLLKKAAIMSATLVTTSLFANLGIIAAAKCGNQWAKKIDRQTGSTATFVWLAQYLLQKKK